jgi:hypothetical protein
LHPLPFLFHFPAALSFAFSIFHLQLCFKSPFIVQDKIAMLAPNFVAVLAFLSISAVVAVPIAVDGLIEKRDAIPADYGKYGDYGSYGKTPRFRSSE